LLVATGFLEVPLNLIRDDVDIKMLSKLVDLTIAQTYSRYLTESEIRCASVDTKKMLKEINELLVFIKLGYYKQNNQEL